ncbi:MAG: hypothetical protein VX438_09250, partial [Planctomycetota bacterium]|nr:hypothetical protein [Planctomycetota bacterium]
GPVSLIRGHLTSEHLRQVQDRVPSVHAITYLRHPTDRLISNFLWRHANHRNSPQKFASPGSFEEFCKLKSSNHMSDLLVGPCESTDEAMDKLKNRFWFVGLTEYYHVCQAILLNLLGSSYRIRKRQNITQSPPAERELITQQGLEIAHAGMEIDFAIYHFFHQQWSAKINDAIEFTMRVASQPNLKRPQQPKSEKLQAA